MVARITLESVVDAVDLSLRAMASAIVMHRKSWLHALGFPRETQNTIENLSFNETHLFNQKTDES